MFLLQSIPFPMNRRDYIQKILKGAPLLFLAPSVLQSCSKDDDEAGFSTPPPKADLEIDLTLSENATLNNPGGARIVQGIMIANAGSFYFAVSSTCTHQGCTVGFNHTAGKIQCPCHGSEFSTNGSVLNGPATQPLRSFTVTRTENILRVAV